MYNKERWSQTTIQTVWEMATTVVGNDSQVYRKDACGHWIQYSKHGDRDSIYGWEIDHIVPVALGGSDYLHNLQPLHWRNNLEKSDSLYLKCAVIHQ